MKFEIKNSSGEKLDCAYEAGNPEKHKSEFLVVMGHGVTANKDRPILTETAKAINIAGFDTLRFSFAGNGESEGDFRDATISKEVADLGAVLDTASKGKKIIYVGHSMGGAVGVLRTAMDSRIVGLISLAGMVNTKKFAETEFGEETPDEGFMWEDEDCPLSSAYMKDLCETIVTVAPMAETISVPWLLVHGTADDVVQPEDSEEIKSLRGDDVELVKIEGGDHMMNEPEHLSQTTAAVADWITRNF
ncbi:alpha/beta hydrolase [Puniceicoccus vermicola]|uniref:Alpha/beta fold hydrolase n=1 Tax=Puniceicoccus vermicola TaxID=388746 RepID=A0A7X1B266_9BACT|nr:alpha/beta fold hydrolase [Puniceicoccus vermicola]MBC2604253.1 alpha/beta fold hydrolase [Puniceicoccus vermicola]